MTPGGRWRRVSAGVVLLADAVVVGLSAPVSPATLAVSALAVLVATGWALWRPGGWGALALVTAQVWLVGARGVPVDVVDWALAALLAAVVLVTHVVLALLAAWPPGAGLPRETLVRTAGQTGALATLGGVAAAVGAVASFTPLGWDAWLAAAAVLLAAVVAAQLAVRARRGG